MEFLALKIYSSLSVVLRCSVLIYLNITLVYIECHSLSGVVAEDVEFYFGKLSEFPSTVATIKYSVNFTATPTSAIMNIYTEKGNTNQQKRCVQLYHGQFFNEKLFVVLTQKRSTTCRDNQGVARCKGTIRIQDYIPRNYFISFGYSCSAVKSLKGLTYNVTIYQRNETKCSLMRPNFVCSKYYPAISMPNLFGNIFRYPEIKQFELQFYMWKSLLGEPCHKYQEQFLCYLLFPECSNIHRMKTLCREGCTDLIDACIDDLLFILRNVTIYDHKPKGLKEQLESETLKEFCNYLPSVNSPVLCFYEAVTCDSPPIVNNAIMQNKINKNKTYLLHSQMSYTCKNETQIRGNNTSACRPSGQWSKPPLCQPKFKPMQMLKSLNPIFMVVPVLVVGVPFLLFIISCSIFRYKRRRTNIPLFRNKTFDAFVSYCYDDIDAQFAENTVRIELEKHIDPPFVLCIHRRDFKAAWDIMWNINNAIKNSNSAIIVTSQDYVNSLWCKEEFEQCYLEHMKDPAFKLFVVMMQPVNTLENTSPYMESFFDHKTYLERNDAKMFKKTSDYLSWVKEPKHLTTAVCYRE